MCKIKNIIDKIGVGGGYFRFIRFGIVGLSNTVIGYLIYSVSLGIQKLMRIFPETDYLIAQVIMFILSVLWSFYWNNRFVFRQSKTDKRHLLSMLIKTYVSYGAVSLLLSELLLILWVDVMNISKWIAPLISLIITVPLNYFLQKNWVFKVKK